MSPCIQIPFPIPLVRCLIKRSKYKYIKPDPVHTTTPCSYVPTPFILDQHVHFSPVHKITSFICTPFTHDHTLFKHDQPVHSTASWFTCDHNPFTSDHLVIHELAFMPVDPIYTSPVHICPISSHDHTPCMHDHTPFTRPSHSCN